MKMFEAPCAATTFPPFAAATVSSVRTDVDPTHTTRPPRALQALIASAASAVTEYAS